MNNLIIIAHRGESLDAPENTLESINLAWQRNADGVEIDIHLTADNKIAVIHDADTKRVSGIHLKISSQPMNELKKLNVGKYKGDRWDNVKIPSLREVLDTVPENKKLFIEIKSGREILNRLKIELNESKLKPDQIKIMCFNFNTLKVARDIIKEYEIFWLRVNGKSFLRFFKLNLDELINLALKNKVNGFNIKYSGIIDRNFVQKVKRSGLKLYAWTVNDIEIAKKLIEYGIDGITSDRPYQLKKQIYQYISKSYLI